MVRVGFVIRYKSYPDYLRKIRNIPGGQVNIWTTDESEARVFYSRNSCDSYIKKHGIKAESRKLYADGCRLLASVD